jgi:phospho-N-acetylmuramoyl-pentapeptide-transferase
MSWIFFAVIISGILSVIVTPLLIKIQRIKNIGKSIRVDGPKSHSVKAGTPTMGGIAFLVSGTVAFVIVNTIKFLRHEVFSTEGLFLLSIFVLCGVIGFLDDFISFKKKRSLGLRGWAKITFLALICIYIILFLKYVLDFSTHINIPLANVNIEIGNWYYLIVVLIILSTTNAVNLTDGLDGLAAGTSSIVIGTFCFIAFLEWTIFDRFYAIDISILGAAVIASCVGFLWWNTAPAEIFMGDTGSFSLGGLIAGIVILLRQEILLIVVGGLFVAETLSVIIQVVWFKFFKRRVFKMAPIHHHFELSGWKEIKIIIRFWFICLIFAGLGFFIYYLKFLD